MDSSAETINAFQALGVGSIAYLKILYYDDVKRMVGPDAEIEPDEYAVALIGADGDPLCIRGTVGDVLAAAEEASIHVVPVH